MRKIIKPEEILIIISGDKSLEKLNFIKKEIIQGSKDLFNSNSNFKLGIIYHRNMLDISDEFLIKNEINFDYLFLGPEFLVSSTQPALGMVYKIMEINKSPCIKFSEEKEKQTIPGSKITFRLFSDCDNANANANSDIICDYLCLENEQENLKDKKIEA